MVKVTYHSVVALILVLCQPVSDVVVDYTSVVSKSKVGVLVLRAGLLLQERGGFAQKILLELVLKGLVGGLGEHGLLLEDGHQTHGLLHAVDGGLQVHPEVDHLPLNTFAHVLLLLKYKPEMK